MSSVPDLTKPASSGWESVHFADAAPDLELLQAAGVRVAAIDGDAIQSQQDLPDVGSWLEAGGHALVIENGDALWKRDPELAGMLVRTWIAAATAWSQKGTPFHLVFAR